jgi:hypothetical protein
MKADTPFINHTIIHKYYDQDDNVFFTNSMPRSNKDYMKYYRDSGLSYQTDEKIKNYTTRIFFVTAIFEVTRNGIEEFFHYPSGWNVDPDEAARFRLYEYYLLKHIATNTDILISNDWRSPGRIHNIKSALGEGCMSVKFIDVNVESAERLHDE